jgi:hypothetical protein
MKLVAALAIVTALTAPVAAQWLTLKTPGIPRTADGKPHLTAPAPRTADGKPDFTGVWMPPAPFETSLDDNAQPWVSDLARQRQDTFFKDRPGYKCLPSGPEVGGGWKRIVQTPTLLAVLNDDLTYRQIFLDGRQLESDPNPSWMGYSVAHWDGDALVVDSYGFNDRTWLGQRGMAHTEALRVHERFRRLDFGHLEQEVTFTDPRAYAKPVSVVMKMQFAADTEMLEAVCESHQDHWVGKQSDAQSSAVRVAPELLANYVGVYSGLWFRTPRTVEFRLADGRLSLMVNGRTMDLVAQSQTSFVSEAGLGYEFIGGDKGMATDVIEHHVSGSYTYPRKH